MIYTAEIVIHMHKRLIETSGGIDGIKNFALLDSAVNSIYQTFDGKELYPSLIEKAADCAFL